MGRSLKDATGNTTTAPTPVTPGTTYRKPHYQKQLLFKLLHDYQLVQYDMTAGDGYLYQTEFFDVEESEHVPLARDQVPQAYVSPQTYDPYMDMWYQEYWY